MIRTDELTRLPTDTASSSSTSTARCFRRAAWRATRSCGRSKTSFGWKYTPDHEDRGKFDFSGKTDPQIVRELVVADVGRRALREGSAARARPLPRGARAAARARARSFRSPESPSCSTRLAAEPRVTLGAPDRQSRARRAPEARAARLQPLLSLRRLRQRLGRPVPASAGRRRAGARAHRAALRGQVGRHRGRLDPRRGLRPVDRRAGGRRGDRDHLASSGSRPRAPTRCSRTSPTPSARFEAIVG